MDKEDTSWGRHPFLPRDAVFLPVGASVPLTAPFYSRGQGPPAGGESPPLVSCSARLPLTSAGGKAAYIDSPLLPEAAVLLFL